jgi:hypothetical protein
VGAPLTEWYGLDAAWWVPLERDARRTFGDALRHTLTHNELTYQLDDIDVPGDPQRRNSRITFHAQPPYPTYGQRPQDFPRVHAPPRGHGPSTATPMTMRSVFGSHSTRPTAAGPATKACWS